MKGRDKGPRILGIAVFPRSLPRFLLRMLGAYVLLVIAMYFLQEKLLHHPSRYSQRELVGRAEALRLAPWPSGEEYRGLRREPEGKATVQGTVALFHGNAGSAADRAYYADLLGRQGCRVLLLEYPGYGARGGSLRQRSLVDDGVASLDVARREFGPPLYVVGESLGAGVAAGALARFPADGAVLITPWDTLPDVAQALYWFLPVRWLVRDRYDSIAHLASYPGPVAFVLAAQDELIPPRCSRRLYDAFAGRKRLWVADPAGHNTWNERIGPQEWGEILGFLGGGTDAPERDPGRSTGARR